MPTDLGRNDTTSIEDANIALSGIDALDLAGQGSRRKGLRRIWSAVWPKLGGIAIGLGLWQLVVWSNWKPDYVLPGPVPVLKTLWDGLVHGDYLKATAITLERAAIGFAVSVVLGTIVGAVTSQVRIIRSAFGSFITGLQTMPSVAWFPLAILLFQLSEKAILFVIVIGAFPSIANGLISGADQVPPLLVRAGKTLGAGRFGLYRHVVLPATLPAFISGLKQGWAFSWRSLMAGELLVVIANKPSIGFLLQQGRELTDSEETMAIMILILIIGILVDAVVFGGVERYVRRRRGLLVEHN